MQTLEINPKFKEYFPELDFGQLNALERSLKSGLTGEPIIYWNNPESGKAEILDGHHRYKMAQKLNLDMPLYEKSFESAEHALLFVIRTQTTRRNIHTAKALSDAVALEIKIEGKTKTEAVESVAEQAGVNRATVYRQMKTELESDITRSMTKAADELRRKAEREGYANDADRMEDEWSRIQEDIQSAFDSQQSEVETIASEMQMSADLSGERVRIGNRNKGTKKSTVAKRDLKSIQTALAKVNMLTHYFKDDPLPIDWQACELWAKRWQKTLGVK